MRQRLFLLRELVRRDFQARYAGSLLGFMWSFVQPLWMLLLFSFVFATVMKVSLVGERTDNFGIFLFCGLLPWTALHEGIQRAALSITDNANMVKKLRFPSELLVLAVVLTALLHEVIAAAVFLVVLLVMGEMGWGGLPMLLLILPVQVALTLGLGLGLSALHVFFRDIGQILGLVLMGWFYFTPIVYPLTLVPEALRPLIELNPLTALVGLYRQALLGTAPRWVDGTWTLVVASVVMLAVGLWLFRRLKPGFVDEI